MFAVKKQQFVATALANLTGIPQSQSQAMPRAHIEE